MSARTRRKILIFTQAVVGAASRRSRHSTGPRSDDLALDAVRSASRPSSIAHRPTITFRRTALFLARP